MRRIATALIFSGLLSLLTSGAAACVASEEHRPVVELVSAFPTADSPGRGLVISLPRPLYPFALRRARIHGEVTIRVTVDAEGKLREAAVVRSTQREFETPALDAVRKWSFLELRDGRDRRRKGMTLDCRIAFSMSDDDGLALF